MRAINCTQCGAVIEDVSERSVIIDCDYCGARIMLDARQSKLEPKPEPVPFPEPYLEPSDSTGRPLTVIGVAVGLMFLVFIVAGVFSVSRDTKESGSSGLYSSPPATPYAYSTPSSWTVSTETPEKPLPVVNYQPRLSWDGPNDIEHFEEPDVDISSVSHLTSEEVKNTVFKNRVVKLRAIINTEGEIDTVETISGHPLLVAAATESAKRSIFRSRSKPTTRVLTFTFRVLKD